MGDRARKAGVGGRLGPEAAQIPTLCRTVGDGPQAEVTRGQVWEQWGRGAQLQSPRP